MSGTAYLGKSRGDCAHITVSQWNLINVIGATGCITTDSVG